MPVRERITTWTRRLLDRGHEGSIPPPYPASRDCGAEPPDAIPPDRLRVDLDSYAARARQAMRAESDLRPMAEIHQEALGEAARCDAVECVDQWLYRLDTAAIDAGLTVLDPVTGYFYGRREPREAHAEIDGALQVARDERDAGLDLEAGR
jgi:hypothetical protein